MLKRCFVFPLMVVLAVPLYSQNPVTDGLMKAAEIARQVRQMELMRAQSEAIRAEQNRLAGEQEAEGSAAKLDQAAELLMDAAINKVAARNPGFWDYRLEMARLTKVFLRGAGSNLEVYIEGLYVIAKYSSFSLVEPARSPSAVSSGEESSTGSVR